MQKQELVEKIEQTGISLFDLEQGFNKICSFPEVEIACRKLEKPDLQEAVARTNEFVKEALNYIPSVEPEKGYDPLQKKIRTAWSYLNYTDLEKEVNQYRVLNCFDGSLDVTLNRWEDRNTAKEYRDVLAPEFVKEWIEPVLREYREYRHYLAVEFLKPALNHYREKRMEKGELTFQDLLMITAEGLKENPSLRQYFKNKYRSLLVDEFQDTDPLQAEILFYLTGSDPQEKDWQNLQPEPGSLFLVGDPKQSIYRFRRADIDIYNTVRNQIEEGQGEVLTLTSNFRSLPEITENLNPVFAEILPEESSSYQARYAPLNAVRPEGKETNCGIKKLNITSKSRKKDAVARADAEKIAKIIDQAVQGGMELL